MQAVNQSIFELARGEPVRLRLVDQYLADQQKLSAVERFGQRHDAGELPASTTYRDLIPLTSPKLGQQYAFHVDLDECTGCKACVAACHSLNGLDDEEIWRAVGLLHGGTTSSPIQQTVTTACHHCIEPACLAGCPVRAYEKDPITGIVRHLDDQCIGCQYCVFTCPYEVPQFNAKKGIVRKCDMCSDRLSVAEAPACVQACPNQAISIRIVEQKQTIEDAQADNFLPGAPSPGITIPTTTYASKRALPRNLLPADFYSVQKRHDHLPLLVMLVLTQLSVGAFATDLLQNRVLGEATALSRPYHALFALLTGLLALGTSVLHLGRPLLAFRAVLGIRTSWMSREIVAFGAFAMLAVLYAAALWQARLAALFGLPPLPAIVAESLQGALGLFVAASGALGVFCSVMIYASTRRRYWSGSSTGFKFFMSAAVLGAGSGLLSVTASRLVSSPYDARYAALTEQLGFAVIALVALKLLVESGIFFHLYDAQHTDLKRAALLMKGELARSTRTRFAAGALGGIVLPAIILFVCSAADFSGPVPVVLAATGLLLALLGELFERRLFFSAMSAPRMPGGLR